MIFFIIIALSKFKCTSIFPNKNIFNSGEDKIECTVSRFIRNKIVGVPYQEQLIQQCLQEKEIHLVLLEGQVVCNLCKKRKCQK